MSERPAIINKEAESIALKDKRLETIQRIESELPAVPEIGDYFRNHPQCVGDVREFLVLYFGSNLKKINGHVIERILEKLPDIGTTYLETTIGQISQIYQEYENIVAEYEKQEHAVYAQLDLNGERFENLHINRLIKKLYTGDGEWDDLDCDIYISKFDNEWQRFYQIIRNEDPLSTLGWRSKISSDIISILGYARHESDLDIEGVFDAIDTYFDIKNIDPRRIPMVIDLLYQSQELEKEDYDAFDDPVHEIDRRIHEYRDVGFRYVLIDYIENRLEPRLHTVFETIKYDAVMEAWGNSNNDYTDGSEITISENQLDALIKESNANRSVESFHIHDRASLMLGLTKDCFADYVANDAFYVIERDVQGNYRPITIKNLLESRGIGGSAVSNDGVAEYRSLMDLRVRASLEKAFGFKLLDLNLKEQYFFLNYLKSVTPEFIESIKQFTSRYGVNGMRTFLSLERGDETLGDNIVAFGQHEEVAGTVFRYYSDLLNSADRAEQLVREVSNCEGDLCTDLANQVRENILNRAQKDLEKAVRAHNPSEVASQIENYVAAAKEYVALLQEVGTEKIESVSPEALTEEDKVRMQELLRKNYDTAYPEPENNEFKATVAGSLVKSFDNPNTTYRILRDQGKIVSFNRFDTLRDYTGKEVSYFGSFNADPAYSGVGGIMLEETIKDQLGNGRPMMAHCDPTQAITKKYIEDGFVATGFYSLAGKPSFEIWRSKDSTRQLESKQKSIEELLNQTEESGSIVVREQSSAETYPELQNAMGLTRYFTHQGKTYLVFEKLSDTLRDEFTPPQEDLKKAA